jgi:transposase-like protein
LEDLKRIQQHYNGMGMDKGFRENMCYVFFLYANLFTGEDREKAMKMTHQFNMGFNHPLNNRMLTTSLRKSKIYYMKNQTILNYCNMDRKEGKKLGLTIAQEKGQKCKTSETPGYKKKKKMKASKGMDRKSQTEKRKQKVFYFLNSGLSIRKAAKSAGVSEQTVLNYKKEHKIIILKMQKTKEHNMERRRLIEMYLSDDLPAANSSTVSQKRPVVVYYNGIMPAMPETVSQEILLFPLCYLDIGLADAGPPGIVKIL